MTTVGVDSLGRLRGPRVGAGSGVATLEPMGRSSSVVRSARPDLAHVVGAALVAAGCTDTATAESLIVIDTRDLYDPCASPDVCPADADCWEVTVDYGDLVVTEELCTAKCFADDDCAEGGRCLNTSRRREDLEGAAFCYQRCSGDHECPGGLGCVDFLDDMDPVCAPT